MLKRLLGWLKGAATEGRSPHWPVARAEHLLAEPACQACGGKEHLQVHHILPVSWPGGREGELASSNLLTLCEAPGRNCHLWVGHLGDFHSRNPLAREDARAFLRKVRSRPYPEAK